jgi:hypothetical protein
VENVGDDKGFKKPIKHKTVNRGVEQGSLFDEGEGMQ